MSTRRASPRPRASNPATRTAQQACSDYCANPIYPLAPYIGTGVVTCTANAFSDVVVPDGQCGTTSGASGGKTAAVTCTLGGRQCSSIMTTPDGTEEFCGSMPTHMFSISPTSISLKGCFDPNAMSGQTFCQNMHLWPDNPIPGSVSPVEFPWVNVMSVTPNSAACSTTTASGALVLGIAVGAPLGLIQVQGATANLTAKGGSFATTTTCDSDNEFCTTNLVNLHVVANDVTVAGVTITNPEVTLTAPVSLGFVNQNQTVQPNTMLLQVAGNVAGFRRVIANMSPPNPLTVTSTSTSMSISGSFPTTINAPTGTVAGATVTMAIAGSTSTGSSCAGQTAVQSLLGFESLQYWASSQATLSLDGTLHTQGCFGMDVGGSGYRTLNSGPLQTPIAGTTSTLALDTYIPPQQPNPSYLGAVQMCLTCPSANQFNMYIGQVELTGKPVGQFSTLNFPIPTPIVNVLTGSHPDCSFTIALNTNQTPKPPVLDNLRFR